MTVRSRWLSIALFVGALAAAFAFLVPPIPQNLAYLDFADRRPFLGVPNSGDVLSNALFLAFGALGVVAIARRRVLFADPRDRWPYLVFFATLFMTGIGSTYFHLRIDLDRLFWDRLPISLAFMALTAAIVGDRTAPGVGAKLLLPLLLVGAASVLVWSIGERAGHGDLRFYAFVQYGSMLALVPVLLFIPSRYAGSGGFAAAFAAYIAAKVCEAFDRPIFDALGAVSGHTLKHLAAGASAFFIVRMLRTRVISA